MKIVATTSLPAVNRPNADCWNAARLCQFASRTDLGKNKTEVFEHKQNDFQKQVAYQD